MRKLFAVLALAASLGIVAIQAGAQTKTLAKTLAPAVTPQPTVQTATVDIMVGASALGTGGSDAEPGTDMFGLIQVKPNSNNFLRTDVFMVPGAKFQGYYGDYERTFPTLLAKTSFPYIIPYLEGGAGAAISNVGTPKRTSKFSYILGPGFYSSKLGPMQPAFAVTWIHAPGYPNKPNQIAVTGGLGMVF